MEKLLIVADSRMYVTNDNKKYKVSIDNNHYARYLQFSNNIDLLMRVEKIDSSKVGKMNEITIPEINLVECPSIMTPINIIKNLKKAKSIIKEHVKIADYIVLKAPGLFCNIAYNYARKYGKKYFAEIGGCPWDGYWNHGISGKIMAPYMYIKTKKIMKNASYSLYVTKFFLEKRYPTDGKYINCSNVTLQDINEEKLKRRMDKINNNFNPKKLVLCTIADVDVKFKGQQYVIEAINKIQEKLNLEVNYILIGRGNPQYLKSIAKKYNVEKNVIFKGSIKHEDVFEALENIDIYVQPSRQEGLPRAVIEAMSCGVPCFGANTAGIPELIEEKYIFSNNNNNIEEIVEIVRKMYNQNELKRVARLNFEKSKEYEFDFLKSKREKIYNEYIEDVKK